MRRALLVAVLVAAVAILLFEMATMYVIEPRRGSHDSGWRTEKGAVGADGSSSQDDDRDADEEKSDGHTQDNATDGRGDGAVEGKEKEKEEQTTKEPSAASKARQATFSEVYEKHKWNYAKESIPKSGVGSSLEYTEVLRKQLVKVLVELKPRTILDLGAGDLTWMPSVLEDEQVAKLNIAYIGTDVVPMLVEKHAKRFAKHSRWRFQQLDFAEADSEWPEADLVFCRDALQHLPIGTVHSVLNRLASSKIYKYALLSTFDKERDNPIAGIQEGEAFVQSWNYNLRVRPFNWPQPQQLLPDGGTKSIGVWRLPVSSLSSQ